jgi:hypothetical protein
MQVDWVLRSFIKTNTASQNMTDIIPGCHELIDFKCTHQAPVINHHCLPPPQILYGFRLFEGMVVVVIGVGGTGATPLLKDKSKLKN